MDETKLLQECKELYESLNAIIDRNDSMSAKDLVKELFNVQQGGKVYFGQCTPTYCQYNGSVQDYTIGGSISLQYRYADFMRLAEDLTMAYYRNNNGKNINYTPNLIKLIKGES
jgi:hypothetical protein